MQIADYEPKQLWKHFDEIRKIPRCSGQEEQARQYVLAFAKDNNFESDQDETGNVVIRVPATSGHENAPVVVIQGHLDMVCEKNSDVAHDFSKDPIQLEIDGEWLKAQGTTLGSDNGVGVAAALACADDTGVVHGPLELLFTVDEETGLIGAGKIQPGFLKAKYLLNLDSEDLGELTIGCAGGGDSHITLALERTDAPKGASALKVHVLGLRGGHSGVDIHEQRGNAVKVLTRILCEGARKFDLSVVSLNGGNKHNAIPREATAEIFVPADKADKFTAWVPEIAKTIAVELGGREKGMEVKVDALSPAPATVLDTASQAKLLNVLATIPHGVDAMNYDIPGLVETSNNLAVPLRSPLVDLVALCSNQQP